MKKNSLLIVFAGIILLGIFFLLLNFFSPKTLMCADPRMLIFRFGNSSPLRGFRIMTAARDRFIKNGEIVSLGQGAYTALSPQMAAGGFQCSWSSANGGSLDDPNACEIIYIPPNADNDILRLRLKSMCGLPDAIGELKISILP